MAKKWIHPKYHRWVKVICIEWFEYTVNAAVKWPIRVESCPKSHPAYTWKKRNVSTKGRAQLYNEKLKKMKELQKAA